MRFELLGPLRAVVAVGAGSGVPGGQLPAERPLGGPKQRLILALLLAEPNTTVSVERLIDGVWGASPPDSARHTLQSYVSELRKSVGDVIERDGTGYAIRVGRDGLDSLEFEARVSDGQARAATDPAAAVAALGAALELWRGRPFEDFPEQDSLRNEATRLEEIRLTAIESLLRGRLELGQHGAVAADLERLTRDHPFREELRALHMLALYRSGRQADALRAYQSTRQVLGEELGIAPSPRLRRLEEQILLQDPALDPDQPELVTGTGADPRIANPYMGLRAFREADAGRFFGQERLVEQLAERVGGVATFTAVVGPSGSGKSSAVQAGLVPRLRCDAPDLLVATVQPGSHPFAELDSALCRVGGGTRRPDLASLSASASGLLEAAIGLFGNESARLLLVVDQFEELFTITGSDETERFVAALVVASQDARARVHVLVTMRADFYDRPLAHPRLGPLFAENVVNVVPLGPRELEAAATIPARQVDVVVDPPLIGRLIADVAGQPNALPLFQYALTELFDERTGPLLDLATYERIGGVRRAVARRAELLYTDLGSAEQEAARQLFLRIATVSGEAVGRRRVPASELAGLDVDLVALQAAIDAFARYRLLVLDRDPTSGSPTVEVAHEALLAEWDRVRRWIDESRDDLATRARLAVALDEWIAKGRNAGYLLTGSRLDDHEVWASATRLRLTETERDFLDRSIEARETTAAQTQERTDAVQRLRRRSRWQLIALSATAAIVAAVVAYPILTSEGPKLRLAVALEAARDQSGFDEIIARGVERAAQDQGLDAMILEPPYTDYTDEVSRLADGADLVIATRRSWAPAEEAATEHPDTTFVFLDANTPIALGNAVNVGFAHEEGSFLVGAAAALETRTGKVGYIGANASVFLIEQFRAGFEQGVAAADPAVGVVSSLIVPDDSDGFLGYTDPAAARRIAEWMYLEEDVDIIFTAAGGSGVGVVEAAAEISDEVGRHLWTIGVDTDSVFELPPEQRDHVLTSMLKRWDVGIERVAADFRAGTLRVPGTIRLGIADGAIGYSTSQDHLAASTAAAVDAFETEIRDGSRRVGAVARGPLREPPPPPPAPDTAETWAGLDLLDRFIAELQAGDVDAAMAHFAPDATVDFFGGIADVEFIGRVLEFDVAAGNEVRDWDCAAFAPRSGLEISCTYKVLDLVGRQLGSSPDTVTAVFGIGEDSITSLRMFAEFPQDYDAFEEQFYLWMEEHHPADVDAAFCCEWDSVDEARRSGEQRARHRVEWAAWLEVHGCTWDDDC